MTDTSRIEELRRRVQKDPASIAFAQLAEEYRRAGRCREAIETCEGGLAHHPGYLSAHVTLGRSLLELGELDAAQLQLKQVLRAAPENLAALRGLAEIHHRRGELQEALAYYRAALEFARHDPELEHLIEQISLELQPNPAPPVVVDGLSFEEAKDAFLTLSRDEAGPEASADDFDPTAFVEEGPAAPSGAAAQPGDESSFSQPMADEPLVVDVPADPFPFFEPIPAAAPDLPADAARAPMPAQPTLDVVESGASVATAAAPLNAEETAQVDALERWLAAILAERQRRG